METAKARKNQEAEADMYIYINIYQYISIYVNVSKCVQVHASACKLEWARENGEYEDIKHTNL